MTRARTAIPLHGKTEGRYMIIQIDNDDVIVETTINFKISGCFDTMKDAYEQIQATLELLRAKAITQIQYDRYVDDKERPYTSARVHAQMQR